MDKRFNGRVAVVTGGGSGIGLAVAQRFAGAGAAVAILERDPDSAARAAALLRSEGSRCEHFVCDVSREQDVARTAEAVSQWAGSVHHLVNNAGIILVKPLDQITVEEWDGVMDVNVKGTFLTAKHFLALLQRESAPTIVNVGSVSSFVAQKHISAYVASKGAVAMLSKAMALDFAERGIRVNCVCPGITDTPMLRYHASQAPDPEAVLKQRRRRVPLGRLLLARSASREDWECRSLNALGLINNYARQPEGMSACATEALAIAVRVGDRALQAEAKALLANSRMVVGEVSEAHVLFGEAIHEARLLRHVPALLQALTYSQRS